MRARAVAVALLGFCWACKHTTPPSVDAGSAVASDEPVAAASHVPSATIVPRTTASAPQDAGAGACTPDGDVVALARPGPYAVVARAGYVDVYSQEDGRPVLAGSIRAEPRPGAAVATAPPVASTSSRSGKPPCAAAGIFVFCMNSEGEIRRFRPAAAGVEQDSFLAHARAGTRITAALVSGHPVVAYLRDRTTSEGRVSEAWVQGDQAPEMRLSDDGAGATTIALASRGRGAVAAYVDARRAMSPIHARTLSWSPKLVLGKDAVLFIAGNAEPGTRVALGVRGPTAFALLPIAHDLGFGLAIVKFDGEPSTDAPAVWSDYPNGLDPAPLAATTDDRSFFIARVRPSAAAFGSPLVLELGTLDAAGAFVSLGVIPTSGAPRDVAVEGDGEAQLILAYTDSAGGHAERLSCKRPK